MSDPDNTVIAEVSSALYGGFVKILSFLAQGMSTQDTFFIKEGQLISKKSAGFIYSDMETLFENNDFEIQDPANVVKLLGLLKGGDKVVFIKDEDQKEYIISNIRDEEADRIVTLPIPDIHPDEVVSKPEIGEMITEIEIPVERVEDIINAAKATDSVYYNLNFDDEFNLYSIETSNGKFKDIIKKKDRELTSYKLFDLMMISKPDLFKIRVYKAQDGSVWIQTVSDIGLVEIEYMEKIDKLSEFDSFSL